jgi:CRISPR/Cas system CSM-associated protein Csm3 (group 7 of RAMP superfamily)
MTEDRRPLALRIELAITARTPLCVGASGSSGGLADKTVLRDGWNRPIIPGSQLKGRLRHACERIAAGMGASICAAPYPATMCPYYEPKPPITRQAREPIDLARAEGVRHQCIVCALFGSPVYLSPLAFNDLVYTPPLPRFPPPQPYEAHERLRPGVGLDRRRRTAQEEVLYLTETTDAGITFTGAIHGRWLSTPLAEARALSGLLLAGLRLTTRWGGGSTRGLGWAEVAITRAELGGAALDAGALLEEVATLCPTE